MQLTVKALQGRECSLQVPEDELVATVKQLVSEKLNVPVRQQRLLFKGKALADRKRLSDYSIGPNSKLNLVVKPLEKVLLEEGAARTGAEPPPAPVWQLVSKILAHHFSAADASRVLEQLQRLAPDNNSWCGCLAPLTPLRPGSLPPCSRGLQGNRWPLMPSAVS
ncbi:ubiquitin-like protein 4A isoform X2 [Heterocephalus glaber]|uniref:Ubiquitin-like protein 4A n=1 Tax=Heterocephalus glaber TaxID=10181 RepID=A0AAX6QK45_HETGA|nr:ubiquitin-like protein 4A isoform X2 [Heterocephalus glaber]XP_004875070.1 ubiquitin-like protein 4A isoform X2 [Heterocephalus glaber]